jgi:hypothetical protein
MVKEKAGPVSGYVGQESKDNDNGPAFHNGQKPIMVRRFKALNKYEAIHMPAKTRAEPGTDC